MNFIEANSDRPFFLYLPHYCVHTPIQAKPVVQARYEAKDAGGLAVKNAGYAAMVESVNVGETTDLATKEPDRVASLTRKLDAWLQSVGAQFPTPNPNEPSPTPARP